ncbi:MAG TPA: hypothetical protein VF929_10645 [Gemmatimonadaceae bacterium]
MSVGTAMPMNSIASAEKAHPADGVREELVLGECVDDATRQLIGGSYSVSATGGLSGNPVTFTSLTPSVCSVSINAVALLGTGSCTLVRARFRFNR